MILRAKRLFALVFCITVSSTVVPGCAGESPDRTFVFGAASLMRPLREAAAAYETRNPGARIDLQFAGSHILAAQIAQGAPADLCLAAGIEPVRALPESRRAGEPIAFAQGDLIWVFRKGLSNIASAESWLASGTGTLVIGVADVPVGRYARDYLNRLVPDGSWQRRVVSFEPDVRSVWGKVMLGEADAGIVYATTPDEGHGLTTFAIPGSLAPPVVYHAVVLRAGENEAGGLRFLTYLTGDEGRAILSRHGLRAAP